MEPYSDDPNNMGKMNLTEKELADSVRAVLALGLQPTIHAMGDKAIDTALNVIEQTPKKVRFRIESKRLLKQTTCRPHQSPGHRYFYSAQNGPKQNSMCGMPPNTLARKGQSGCIP